MNRKNISYIGLFVEHMDGLLEKGIPNQHVTLAFAPTAEQLDQLLPYLGSEWEISPVGYGNDGKNEGLLVEVSPRIPYFGAEQKHITLSISLDGKAVNTGSLEFGEMPEDIKAKLPDKIIGRAAAFTKDRELVFSPREFQEYSFSHEDILSKAMIAKCKIDGFTPLFDRNLMRFEFNLISGDEKIGVSLDDLQKLFKDKANLEGRTIDLEIIDPVNGTSFTMTDVKDVASSNGSLIIMNDDYIFTNLYGVGQYIEEQRALMIANQITNPSGTDDPNGTDDPTGPELS